MDSRTGLADLEKTKISYSCRKLNPQFLGRPARGLVTIPSFAHVQPDVGTTKVSLLDPFLTIL
jgi:hypothetical protein